jgi:hypothetical protein
MQTVRITDRQHFGWLPASPGMICRPLEMAVARQNGELLVNEVHALCTALPLSWV